MNVFDVRYLTLDGVVIRSQFDPFHCEQCTHVTLRRSAFVGIGNQLHDRGPQETVKINQSSDIRIEDSYIAGATDNAIDFVAVNKARIVRNTIAHAQDWCAYAKGGSNDISFVANEVHHCGTGGITLGQGTGFEFMRSPWLHYEAYGSSVVNNLIHDTDGAALGVNGGFAILMAYNTAYRTGSRDHALEVVYGERSCDGNADACAANRAAGGWGPSAPGGDSTPIGNDQVSLLHNLVYNPPSVRSQWTHFAVYAPRPAGGSGGPDPARADDGLVIRGNAIWNGPVDLDLGLGGDQGCSDTHPTCSPSVVRDENDINRSQPQVRITASVAPVPAAGARIEAGSGASAPITTFDWTRLPTRPQAPAVTMPTAISLDRAGRSRAGRQYQPGAYVAAAPTTLLRVAGTGMRGSIVLRSGDTLRSAVATRTVLRGSWLELTAQPARGMRVAGWDGACVGTIGPVCILRVQGQHMGVSIRFTR